MDLNLIEEAAFLREICDKEILKIVCQETEKENLLKELKKNLEYRKIAVEYDEDTYEFFRLDNLFHEIIYKHCGYNKYMESCKKIKYTFTID